MAFLAPATLLGLLLVSLPLAIHLLVRRRGRRLDFPSLRFLRETPSFQLYPRRIRQPLLLLLRAAAIILLVMGLARPFITFRTQKPEAVRFILMDASLSMKTRGRAEAAREQARAIVNQLTSNERASVIALSSEAIILVELTGDREKLLEAISRYQPTGDTIDYGVGFREIRRQLQSEPQVAAQADIISDFQEAGLEAQAEALSRENASLGIATYPVGSAIERNAFFIDEAAGKTERGIELSASEIISENNGRSGTRRVWMIEGKMGAGEGIEWRTETNGQITGRLRIFEPDDFDADDERYFAFAPPRENRILLIEDGTDASLFLSAALEANANQEGAKRSFLDKQRNLPERAADLAAYSLVVVTLHGSADETEARTLAEYARAGGTVWMFLARDLDTASWSQLASGDALQGALPFESIARKRGDQSMRFGAMDAAAPQLRGLDESALAALRAVRVTESYAVTPRASADTLIRWSDASPAFISARAGSGRIMLLATSPERASSELGLSPSFSALTSSILRVVSAPHDPLSQTIGEAVRLGVAPETDVKITDAEGRVAVTKARELVRQPLSYFNEPGIYHLEFAGQQKSMAFNASTLESERALAPDEELTARFSANAGKSAREISADNSREAMERSGVAWRYFLCAAFLLMIAELFVAIRQRKIVDV
ncbi:MAG: hypothetical protein QOH25_1868 [Acidobacteriota bacterium]|jgi:hypothetical protein|nr:hypothetical protein [Acidobacteriota bacterium]